MRLYVCYGTFGAPERHACARAYCALVACGYQPDVTRTYGRFGADRLFSQRREVRRLSGRYEVPLLVIDDKTVVCGSQKIIAWAHTDRWY